MFVKKLIKWYLVFKIVSGILLIPAELSADVISVSISEIKLYLFEMNKRVSLMVLEFQREIIINCRSLAS